MKVIALIFLILGVTFANWDNDVEYNRLKESIKDQYIAAFKKGVSEDIKTRYFATIKNYASIFGEDNRIVKEFRIGDFHAFLIKGTKSFATFVAGSGLIDYVVEDGIVTLEGQCEIKQSDVWGLVRVSHRQLSDSHSTEEFEYRGAGVTAYIIDTGVYLEHQEFEGRATWGDTFTGDGNHKDCHGHGTHVAGILGSRAYGVAKDVSIVAVKVLNCGGSGSFSGIISGVEWVARQHQSKGKPSVANMSLGGSLNKPLDDAVEAMIKAGVATAVSAGNTNSDACYHSVRTDYALTTGSSTRTDQRSSFSNYGKCVDFFAPGSDILSTFIGSPTDTKVLSGTSMASPHAAGLAARILSENPSLSPLEVKAIMKERATKNVLDLNCMNQACNESPNLLVYGGCDA